MKQVSWVVGIGAFCLMLYVCALPGQFPTGRDGDASIAGTYTVNGVDPTDLEYSGTMVIVESADRAGYNVEWIITGGIQRGTGVLRGDRFTVNWRAVSSVDGDEAGTASYQISADGAMRGQRTVDGYDKVGTEEVFPES